MIFIRSYPDGEWEASWQDDDALLNLRGDEHAVVAWARIQPAERRVIWSDEDDDYRPLEESE